MLELCFEHGFQNLSLDQVLGRAEVSSQVFKSHFKDLEDCLCRMLEEIGAGFFLEVLGALSDTDSWREQLRQICYVMLRYWQSEPMRARMMTVDVFHGGTRVALVRDEHMEPLIDFIDLGRQELEDPDSLTRATAQAIAGTMFRQISAVIAEGDLSRGDELIPKLMYSVVLPYLGPDVAAECLSVTPPESKPSRSR